MRARAEVEAGICGFRTSAEAASDDGQHVTFAVSSDCEKIRGLAEALRGREPLDAFQEISPAEESVLLGTARATLKGCCAGCAVPAGLFKTMQVAAGLALPRDISLRLSKED